MTKRTYEEVLETLRSDAEVKIPPLALRLVDVFDVESAEAQCPPRRTREEQLDLAGDILGKAYLAGAHAGMVEMGAQATEIVDEFNAQLAADGIDAKLDLQIDHLQPGPDFEDE